MFRETANEYALRRTVPAIMVCALLVLATLAVPAFSQAGHVHELYYNNSNWTDTDLTALTGGASATFFGAITAFYTVPNGQLHVYYVDAGSQHVHQLYYNNSTWSDSDLTSFTGGPTASPYGITGFAIGNFQYIFYEGTDNHVHQIVYNNFNWTDQDITALAGSAAAGLGPILAFATKPNNQFHVYYQTTENLDLHQLYFNGTSWIDSDLTSITGAYCYSDWLAGFASANLQHVFCPGFGAYSSNLDMLHLFYNNFTWTYEDITFRAGGSQTPMNLGSGVAAFQIPATTQLEVYGVTDDTHVHQYTRNKGQWIDMDLTAVVGAPTDSQFGGIAAFPTTPNNQFHIYYAPSTEVYQTYYNGLVWSVQDLTGGGGQANNNSGMAGFARGNLQHVYYIANSN